MASGDIYGLARHVFKQVDLTIQEYAATGQVRDGELIVDVNPGPTQYQIFVGRQDGNVQSLAVTSANYANFSGQADNSNTALLANALNSSTANVTILGGDSGQFLQSTGNGGVQFEWVKSIINGNSTVSIPAPDGTIFFTVNNTVIGTMSPGSTVFNDPVTLAGAANIGGPLEVLSDTTVHGNLNILGNLTYINVNDLRVEDPIIQMGGGPNGAPLTANDGKDRGLQLHTFDTGANAEVDKFMIWKDAASEFQFVSNGLNANDVVTVNSLGNVRADTFFGNLVGNITGNINANVITANTIYGNIATAAQPGITSVGTLTDLEVAGNANIGGNIVVDNLTVNNTTLLSGVTYSGSIPADPHYTVAPLNLNNSGPAGDTRTQLNLINSTGGVGTGSAIDFYTYTDQPTNSGPGVRISASDDGAFSGYFQVSTKDPGDPANPLSVRLTVSDIGDTIITSTSPATTPGTGALLAVGGISTYGNVVAGGNVDATDVNASGSVSAVGNVSGGNITTGGVVSATGNVSGGNITTTGVVYALGNVVGANLVTGGEVDAGGNITGANVMSVGIVSAIGNVSGGNLTTAGQVVASGNVSGGNVTTSGVVSATGNVSGGNVTTSGVVSATGNVSGGNLNTTGRVVATGNVSGGNLTTDGEVVALGNISGLNVSATENITANNSIANRFLSTSTVLNPPSAGNYSGERLRLYDFNNPTKTNYAIGAEGSYVWFGVDSNSNNQGFKFYGNTTLAATITGSGNIVAVGNITGANLVTSGVANVGSLVVSGTSNLGVVSNVTITGGSNGFMLTTNGSGGLSWTNPVKKYTREWHVDPVNGSDFNGDGSYQKPYQTITQALAAVDNSGQAIYLHAGTYSENVTVSKLNLDIIGVNGSGTTLCSGTWTFSGASSSVRVAQCMFSGAVNITGNVGVYFRNCNLTGTLTKSGNGYLQSDNSTMQGTGVVITGTGTVNLNSTYINLLTVNNASATVAILNSAALAVATLTAGTLLIQDSFVYSAAAATNAIASSAGSILYVVNSTLTTPAGGSARVSIAGAYTLGGMRYDSANSTITGINLATVSTFDALQAVSTVTASGNIQSNASALANTLRSVSGALTLNTTSNGNIVLQPNGTGVVNVSNVRIANVAEPTQPSDAATKNYVDNVAEGLHIHASANAATTGTLATISGGTVTYNNGTLGVGATLTTTGSYTTIDGVTLSNGMRIIVKNEANAAHNGVYTRTSATVLTRATDMDTAAEMAGGDFIFVTGGTLYDNTGWVQTLEVLTVGTDPLVFEQFSGAGTYTAGTGLTLSGTQFSISNTAVTSGSYGNATHVGTFTVNSQGQLTAASNTQITANAAALTGTTLATNVITSSLTSVGTLGSLTVSGSANIGTSINAASIALTNTANVGTTLTVTGNTTTGNLAVNGVSNLGAVDNVRVSGGNSGEFLQTNGNGVLSWTKPNEIVNGGSNVSIATSGGDIEMFVNSSLVGTISLVDSNIYTNLGVSGIMVAGGGLTVTGVSNLGSNGNVIITGGNSGQFLQTNGSGALSWASISTSSVANGNSSVSIPTANGNIVLNSGGGANEVVVTSSGLTINGNLGVNGVSNLGPVGNVVITGGSNGQVLSTDGTGVLSWTSISTSSISNGNSSVSIPAANGNVIITAAGGNNEVTVTGTGLEVTGTLSVNNTVSSPVYEALNTIIVGNTANTAAKLRLTSSAGNVFVQTGNGTTNSTGNIIFSAYNDSNTIARIDTSSGDFTTTGAISATGNVSGGNLTTGGVVSATGNVSGGNLTTGGVVSATGNVSGGNITTAGAVAATGNVSGGNITTGGAANVGTLHVTGTSNLGPVGNVIISGGSNGQYLRTNGSGVLSWANAGSANAITNGTTDVSIGTTNGGITANVAGNLTLSLTTTGRVMIGNGANANANNGIAVGFGSASDGESVALGVYSLANKFESAALTSYSTATGNRAVAIGSGALALQDDTVALGSNITITAANSIAIGRDIVLTDANVILLGNSQQNTRVSGNLTVASVSNLGAVGNVIITGGSNGQVLTTNGSGVLSWQTVSSGGGSNVGSPQQAIIEFTANANGGNGQSFTNAGISNFANTGVALVFVNGVQQRPSDYTIVGNTLTITSYIEPNGYVCVGPLQGLVGGNANTLQFNNGGVMGGVSTATWDGTVLSLGSNANISISGGSNGQVLTTNGSGGLSWANGGSGGSTLLTVTNVSGPAHTVQSIDQFIYVTSTTATTITLPASVTIGRQIIVKDGLGANRAGNAITVDVTGGNIDGNSSYTINAAWNTVTFVGANANIYAVI